MNYILTERAREKSTMYKYCTLTGYQQFFYFEIRVLPHSGRISLGMYLQYTSSILHRNRNVWKNYTVNY
jgi:hypothetical protein